MIDVMTSAPDPARPLHRSERRRAASLTMATVLAGALLVILVTVWRTGETTSPSECTEVEVALAQPVVSSTPHGAGPLTMDGLLLVQRSGSAWGMPSSSESVVADVVIEADGGVVAVADWDGTAVRYRAATLAPATMTGLRACLADPAILAIPPDGSDPPDALGEAARAVDEKEICRIADAPVMTITAGGGGGPRRFRTYDFDQPVLGDGACRRSEAVSSLRRTLRSIRVLVASEGVRTEPPLIADGPG